MNLLGTYRRRVYVYCSRIPDRQMADGHRLEQFIRAKLQDAGERYESFRQSTDQQLGEARSEYSVAKNANSLPTDTDGRVKIVCRRHTDQRATRLDGDYRPVCYEPDHPDCEGCVEDIYDGRIETW